MADHGKLDRTSFRDAINVPRGILETACDYDHEETRPELVNAISL